MTDEFLVGRGRAEQSLENVLQLLRKFDQAKRQTGRSREVVQRQAEIRREVDGVVRQVRQLQEMLAAEQGPSKRKSILSKGDLQERFRSVEALQAELQNIQDYQRSGFISSYQRLVFPTTQVNDLKEGETSGWNRQEPEGITSRQREGLQEIRDTDKVIDVELGSLEAGSAVLKEVARKQNEEVKQQNNLLLGLDDKMDATKEKATIVNKDLRKALHIKKKKRSCDVIMTNFLCVLMSCALLVVLVLLLMNY